MIKPLICCSFVWESQVCRSMDWLLSRSHNSTSGLYTVMVQNIWLPLFYQSCVCKHWTKNITRTWNHSCGLNLFGRHKNIYLFDIRGKTGISVLLIEKSDHFQCTVFKKNLLQKDGIENWQGNRTTNVATKTCRWNKLWLGKEFMWTPIFNNTCPSEVWMFATG